MGTDRREITQRHRSNAEDISRCGRSIGFSGQPVLD